MALGPGFVAEILDFSLGVGIWGSYRSCEFVNAEGGEIGSLRENNCAVVRHIDGQILQVREGSKLERH